MLEAFLHVVFLYERNMTSSEVIFFLVALTVCAWCRLGLTVAAVGVAAAVVLIRRSRST